MPFRIAPAQGTRRRIHLAATAAAAALVVSGCAGDLEVRPPGPVGPPENTVDEGPALPVSSGAIEIGPAGRPEQLPEGPFDVPEQPAGTESGASTTATLAFTPLTIIDPMLGGQPAFSVLVPDGWQAFGEVQWLPFWSRQAFLQTRVYDPTSGIVIDWLPVQDFMYFTPPAGFEVPIGGNYQGKEYRPPIFDPLEFVRTYWMTDTLSHLQNATVAFVEEQPAAARAFIDAFEGAADAGAWRIRYVYEADGVVYEQDVSFALLWTGSDPMSWYVNYASTAGAPAGELDRQAGLVSAVVASRTSTVAWEADYRLVQRLFYQGLQQQIADTQRLVELLAQYRAESQALQQQVVDERAASIDRRNEVFRETLGGVVGMIDPVNQVLVQLPLGGDTYWVNEAGQYLVVTDPLFDPNAMNDGTWTPLVPRP